MSGSSGKMLSSSIVISALVLAMLMSGVDCGFADVPRCKTTFRVLESQSADGARHSPLLDVFSKKDRLVGEVAVPDKELRFHNDIYPACYANQTALVVKRTLKLGFHQGHCIETYAPFVSLECYFSWVLPKGTLSSQGPLDLATGLGILAVTGGTGEYIGAKGEVLMELGNTLDCNVGDATVSTYRFCLV